MSDYSGKINIKNRESTTDILSYDGSVTVNQYIGGTSGELNKTVGGSGIKQDPNKAWVNDIGDLLAELTTGNRTDKSFEAKDIAGIDGVELISVTSDSFTVQFRGWDGTYDTLMIEGDGVADIIAEFNASTKDVDLKGFHSEFEVITFDDYSANFNVHIGGTSGELRDVIGGAINHKWGSRRERDEDGNWEQVRYQKATDLDDLFQEMVTGDARPTSNTPADRLVGIDGVELMSLTDDTFVLKTKGWAGTEDTLVFTGDGIRQVIENADQGSFGTPGGFDVNGWKSNFMIVEYEDGIKVNMGGQGGPLKNVTGRQIEVNEDKGVDDVQVLLEQLVHGERADRPDRFGPEEVAGIDNVELLEIDQDSFSIRMSTWSNDRGAMYETILFTNVEDVITEVMTGESVDDLLF